MAVRNGASEPGRRDGLRYLRRLFVRYLPGERRLILLAFLMLVLEAGAAVAEAWPIARLIDVIKGDKDRITVLGTSQSATVLFLAIVIVGLAVLTSLCDSAAEILLGAGWAHVRVQHPQCLVRPPATAVARLPRSQTNR